MVKISRKTLFVLAFYVIITIFLSWPLILHLDGFLLSKVHEDISHSDTEYQINYMLKSKELFLDHQNFIIIQSKYAMPQSYVLFGIFSTVFLGLNEIVFHNLFFLLCVFLSGIFMYFFMLELSKDRIASFFSGFLYMSSNFLFHQYMWGHTNILQIQWIPLIFLFLEKTLKKPKEFKYSIFLGVCLSLQVISSVQYTVYISVVIPFYILLRTYFVNRKTFVNKYFWINMFVSTILAIAFSSFYLIKRLNMHSVIRTIEENLELNWRMQSLKSLFDVNSHMYLGIIQVVLILLGISITIWYIKNKRYRIYIPFAILFIFFTLCMFGPASYFLPYYWLYKFWPFINHFRTPVRLFPFVLICSSILSSLFLLSMQKVNALKKYKFYILIVIMLIITGLQILSSYYFSSRHLFYL